VSDFQIASPDLNGGGEGRRINAGRRRKSKEMEGSKKRKAREKKRKR